MTKEECIGLLNRYAEYNGMGIPNLAGCREAMRTAAELLQQPSLPSNLDAAAHHFSVMVLNNPAFLPNAPFSEILKILDGLFKAGAEWMARQGETRDDIVVTGDFDGKAHIFPIPSSEFNPGDKVVVQIRKK